MANKRNDDQYATINVECRFISSFKGFIIIISLSLLIGMFNQDNTYSKLVHLPREKNPLSIIKNVSMFQQNNEIIAEVKYNCITQITRDNLVRALNIIIESNGIIFRITANTSSKLNVEEQVISFSFPIYFVDEFYAYVSFYNQRLTKAYSFSFQHLNSNISKLSMADSTLKIQNVCIFNNTVELFLPLQLNLKLPTKIPFRNSVFSNHQFEDGIHELGYVHDSFYVWTAVSSFLSQTNLKLHSIYIDETGILDFIKITNTSNANNRCFREIHIKTANFYNPVEVLNQTRQKLFGLTSANKKKIVAIVEGDQIENLDEVKSLFYQHNYFTIEYESTFEGILEASASDAIIGIHRDIFFAAGTTPVIDILPPGLRCTTWILSPPFHVIPIRVGNRQRCDGNLCWRDCLFALNKTFNADLDLLNQSIASLS